MNKNIFLKPDFFKGKIVVPASKSVAQRAIAAAVLSEGMSVLKNISFSDDVKVALRLAETLGAKISIQNSTVEIEPNFHLKKNRLEVGEAGLSTRMFLPIAALIGQEFHVVGEGSILKRKMDFLAESMLQLGVNIQSENGFLPFVVNGKLTLSEDITIDASESSQLLTGILMALPKIGKKLALKVENLKSKPYIDLTLDVLAKFGVEIENEDYKLFKISPSKYQATEIDLEGDWSGASFWFVAASIAGNIEISGLLDDSKQADRAILEVLRLAKANFSYENGVYLVKKSKLKAFQFDATDCPDLFPPLAALAVACDGISRISGVHRLANKESNRAVALVKELSKMEVSITIENDDLLIEGSRNLMATQFNSYNDHRMAMTGAVLSLLCEDEVEITDYQCVNKSYPEFFDDFKKLSIK